MKKYDNGWLLTPEEQLEYIKENKRMFDKEQPTFSELDFLTLLGWEKTSNILVYRYEKEGDIIMHTAHDEGTYFLNDKPLSEEELLKFIKLD